MVEKNKIPNEEIIPSIIAAAIAAAGPIGNNEGAWKGRLNAAIPHVAAMIHDGSRQWKIAEEVLDAAVFVAEYVSHEVEASSTRCLVRIDTGRPSKNYPDGIEPIRTHRTDGAQGKNMKALLDKLTPGDNIVVWKSIEASDDGNEKYRVLVHLETRPKRDNKSQAATRPPQPREEEVSGRSAPAAPSSKHLSDSIDSEKLQKWRAGAMEALGDDQFTELSALLRQNGLDFYGVSEVEWVEYIRPLVKQLLAESK